jgi:hypothetical protein
MGGGEKNDDDGAEERKEGAYTPSSVSIQLFAAEKHTMAR